MSQILKALRKPTSAIRLSQMLDVDLWVVYEALVSLESRGLVRVNASHMSGVQNEWEAM